MAEPVKKIMPNVFGRFPTQQPVFEFTPEGQADLGWDPEAVQRTPFDAYAQPPPSPAEVTSPLVEAGKGIRQRIERTPAMNPELRQKINAYMQSRGRPGIPEGPPVTAPGRSGGIKLEELPEDIRPRMVTGRPVYFRPDYAERVAELDITDEQKRRLLEEQKRFAQTPAGMESEIYREEGLGLEKRSAAQMKAGEIAAWGDKMVADAIDQGILDQQDLEDQKQLFFQEWRTKTLQETERQRVAIERLEAGDGPDWKKEGVWGKGVAMIAALLFGRGNPMVAQAVIHMVDLEAEKAAAARKEKLERQKFGVTARSDLLGHMSQYSKNEQQAIETSKLFYLKQFDLYRQGLEARTASGVRKARLEELGAALQTELATREKRLELANTLAAQQEAAEAARIRMAGLAASRKALEKQLEGYEYNPLVGKHVPKAENKELTQKMMHLDSVDSALAQLKQIGPSAIIPGTAENQRAKMLAARIGLSMKEIYAAGAHDKALQEVSGDWQGYDPTSIPQRIWGSADVIDEARAAIARERELTKSGSAGVPGIQVVTPEGEVVKGAFPTGQQQLRERVETGQESATGVSPGAVRKYEGKPK